MKILVCYWVEAKLYAMDNKTKRRLGKHSKRIYTTLRINKGKVSDSSSIDLEKLVLRYKNPKPSINK